MDLIIRTFATKPLSTCVVCGLICIAAGCGSPDPPATTPPDDSPITGDLRPRPPQPAIFERRVEQRIVEFKVHRISAPRGAFTESPAIWDLASGRLPSAESAMHLSANGFRVGIGLESHREPLLEMLKSIPNLRTAVDHALPDALRMVDLELGACPPSIAIFYIGRSGALRGLDFVNARARLKLTFEMRAPRFEELWLRIIPELEEPPGPMRWEMTPDGPRQTPQLRRRTFEDLACEARIPPGGFLLLGPAPAVYDRPLAARPFFIEKPDILDEPQRERESILVISPLVRTTVEPAGFGAPGVSGQQEPGASVREPSN